MNRFLAIIFEKVINIELAENSCVLGSNWRIKLFQVLFCPSVIKTRNSVHENWLRDRQLNHFSSLPCLH